MGDEKKKGELKENTVANTTEIDVRKLPLATIVAGGCETKGENQHEMERWHNPQSREWGKCLAENAWQRENKTACITKKRRRKHTVLCHCVSSQITLAAPRLGDEEGVGRTTKKKRTRKNYSPVRQFSGPITQTMAPY